MSVDLPAPFSPISECTSPGQTERRTLSSARTPGKVLLMPRISSSGGVVSELDMALLLRLYVGLCAGAHQDACTRRKVEEHRQRGRAERARVGAEGAAHQRGRAARLGGGGGHGHAQALHERVDEARVHVGVEHHGGHVEHAERGAQRGRERVDAIVEPFLDRRMPARDAGFEIGAAVDGLAAILQMAAQRDQRRAREQDVPFAVGLVRRRQVAGRHRHHREIARVAGQAAHAIAVDGDAATDRRAEKQIEEIVALTSATVEDFGDGGGVAVVFAEHGQAGRAAQLGGEIDVAPDAEGIGGQAQFAQPAAEVVRLRHADAREAAALVLVEQSRQFADVALHDFLRERGLRQQHVVRAAADHPAREIDEHGFDVGPVQTHADGECAARRQAQQRGGLATSAVEATAAHFDQTIVDQRRDDAAHRRAGEIREAREVGLRRLAGAPQRLQQQTLVEAADIGRIAALTDMRTSHASPP
ncbi:hypothetical protein PT2222_260108 [Paraburkholderia tropica]